jgi:multidrug efflux pump
MARLRGELDHVQGIQAWMQPVQELSIEDKISRTQYQLSLTQQKHRFSVMDTCLGRCFTPTT